MDKDKIPENATHVQVPVDLFKELLSEANHGYHGFNEDTNLWKRISFVVPLTQN